MRRPHRPRYAITIVLSNDSRRSDMTTEKATDASWAALAEMDDTPRAAAMEERFTQLALLGEAARVDAIEAMIRAEFSLPEEQLQAMTAARLRVWASLNLRDPGQAKQVVAGYDDAMNRLPADMAMRRAGILYTVAREMPAEEVAILHDLIPSLRQSVPVARTGLAEERTSVEEARTRRAANPRPFWKFWA
jgi:hypothetical protein